MQPTLSKKDWFNTFIQLPQISNVNRPFYQIFSLSKRKNLSNSLSSLLFSLFLHFESLVSISMARSSCFCIEQSSKAWQSLLILLEGAGNILFAACCRAQKKKIKLKPELFQNKLQKIIQIMTIFNPCQKT